MNSVFPSGTHTWQQTWFKVHLNPKKHQSCKVVVLLNIHYNKVILNVSRVYWYCLNFYYTLHAMLSCMLCKDNLMGGEETHFLLKVERR
jgi:hypothetical protein